jgi:hypothetical protein
MRTFRFLLPGLPALVLLVGCATSEEWDTWKSHPAHFASGDHMVFSVRNTEATKAARVTRQDVALAREQSWWGKAITVEQGQILEQ